MKNRISFGLLFLLPFLLILVNVKIYWVFHLLILIVVILEKKEGRKYKSHLFLLLVIPLFWTFFFSFQDSLYFVIQALFYLTTPFLLTSLGMKLSRITDQKMVFKYIIYFGTINALYYVGFSFYFIGLSSFINPFSIRELLPWGSITSVITVFALLFSEKFGIILIRNKKIKYFLIGVNLLATYFSASRTYYVIFLVFIFIFLYKNNKKMIFFVFGLMILIFSIFLTSDSDNTLVKKIQSGTSEISIGNYQTDDEINTKYRGFETNMALETYLSGTEENLIFGHGFEKQIDLKTEVFLGNEFRSVIPVIHNGYLYILIKLGLLGLIFYFAFFVNLFKLRYKAPKFTFFNMIITGCIISILFSNYVVGTFFSMEMNILWMLFGIYIGLIEIERRKKNSFKLSIE